MREVTLLGQIVDRYGKDLPGGPTPVGTAAAGARGRRHRAASASSPRIPTGWTTKLLGTVAELPKVCEHIEVPVQAGDDEVLARMKRGYTVDQYRRLIERIRTRIPGASIATDIIVGFPGESEAQFQRTYDLLAELQLDVAHLARYSPGPEHSPRAGSPTTFPTQRSCAASARWRTCRPPWPRG